MLSLHLRINNEETGSMIRNIPKDGKITYKDSCDLEKKSNLDQAIAKLILEVHNKTKNTDLLGKGK